MWETLSMQGALKPRKWARVSAPLLIIIYSYGIYQNIVQLVSKIQTNIIISRRS